MARLFLCVFDMFIHALLYNNSQFVLFLDSRGFPPIIIVINILKVPVFAFVVTLVAIGVILSILCLMFDVIFKNQKSVTI